MLKRPEDFSKLKRTVTFLRIMLTILTVAIIVSVTGIILITNSVIDNSLWPIFLIIASVILYYPCLVIFLIYATSKFPGSSKIKLDKALMMFFIPLIGMWLWLPNSRELSKIKENYYCNKEK